MNGVVVRANHVQLPNHAFESGRAEKRRAAQRER